MDSERIISDINPAYAGQRPLAAGWIYIAVDMRDLRFTKIGLTTKDSPAQRISEGRTYNPFLTLFTTYELAKCTFGISAKELRDIEGYIHRRGSAFGPSLGHIASGRKSEWFRIRADNAERQVDWILAKRAFSVDREALYDVYDGPHSLNGVNIPTMRKIKSIYRPEARALAHNVMRAGYDADLIAPYLRYLEEFYRPGNPDQAWLKL